MPFLKPQTWPKEAFTEQQIRDRIVFWREKLLDYRPREQIQAELDKWLDELLELRGR